MQFTDGSAQPLVHILENRLSELGINSLSNIGTSQQAGWMHRFLTGVAIILLWQAHRRLTRGLTLDSLSSEEIGVIWLGEVFHCGIEYRQVPHVFGKTFFRKAHRLARYF